MQQISEDYYYKYYLQSGKLRQYNLGKWFRDRYDNILSRRYLKKELSVQSSNFDRCLMSAASNLAGLYNLSGNDMWLKNFPWEPVPIHTRTEENDPYLAMSQSCPRHEKLLNDLKEHNEIFQELPKKYRKEYEIVANHTGWNVAVDNFQGLYSAFYVYAMHNKSFIPAWAYLLNKTNFVYLAGLSFASETFTDDLKTLKAGPFYHNLMQFFDLSITGEQSPKFLMLSAHDGTVVAALQIMGVYDFEPPEFTSTVIWELHMDEDGSYFMKIYYKKPSREELTELKISECGYPCNYNNFSNIVGKYIVDERTWKKMCKMTEEENHV